MKGIVLTAGQGVRLFPLTLEMPKPLIPVANIPMIFYPLNTLKRVGITDVAIVVSHIDSGVYEKLGDGTAYGFNIEYVVQDQQLGIAHAVRLCKEFVDGDDFALLFGDNIYQDDLHELFGAFLQKDVDALLALIEVPDPQRFGVANIQDQRIVTLVEKPQEPQSNFAVTGTYLFRKNIFDAIDNTLPSKRGELEITDAIQNLIRSGGVVKPYFVKGWWIDSGTHEALLTANQLVLGEMKESKVAQEQLVGDCQLLHKVDIGHGAQIVDSIIRGPAIIGEKTVIKNSYIGPYTSIGNNVRMEEVSIENSIVMDDCTLRDVVQRIDSSILGKNSEVAQNQTSQGRIKLILDQHSSIHLAE